MPERKSSEHHDNPQRTEQETLAYYRVARFPGEEEAGRYYHATLRLFRDPDVDLSAYRLQLNQIWHVAVIGSTSPPADIAKKVEGILDQGELATLPPDILKVLLARREQVLSPGTNWFERHYRPGRRI